MEDKVAIEGQDVPLSDQFQTIYHVVVLRVRKRCEKVLNDLKQEEYLRVDEHIVERRVSFSTKCDNIEGQKHIRHDNDRDQDVEECDNATICVQNVSTRANHKIRHRI